MGQRPLSGVEIVRVATHPEVRRMGYGLRAVHMALRYFRGDLIATVEEPHEQDQEEAPQEVRHTLATSS
jgi:N-acetyltransferase 10